MLMQAGKLPTDEEEDKESGEEGEEEADGEAEEEAEEEGAEAPAPEADGEEEPPADKGRGKRGKKKSDVSLSLMREPTNRSKSAPRLNGTNPATICA